MKESELFTLLQINDAQFPIGGYSHSYGLETYIQKGLVKNADDAYEFLVSNIENSFLTSDLLPARLAYEYAEKRDMAKIEELEELLEASKSAFEIRSAAQKLGSRFVKTVVSMGTEFISDFFLEYEKTVKMPTYAVAYGVFCACMNMDKRRAMEQFLYTNTAGKVVCAVKTIPLSQTDGQKILYSCHDVYIRTLDRLETLDESHLCLSNPGFDIRAMQHEALYSRLYMS